MPRDYDFFVYMTTNYAETVLYIGVTSDLAGRVWEHQHGEGSKFTRKHHADRLLFYEHFGDVQAAIAREKQLKGWTRAKKEALIRTMNPGREDITYQLDPHWQGKVEGPSTLARGLAPAQDDRSLGRDDLERKGKVDGVLKRGVDTNGKVEGPSVIIYLTHTMFLSKCGHVSRYKVPRNASRGNDSLCRQGSGV